MITCDLCGRPNKCTPRQIERKEYDICSQCWKPIAEKLKGKGRAKTDSAPVILPQATTSPEPENAKPDPGQPPKIWAAANRTQ